MDVAIQLISSHPVLIHALQKIGFQSEGFSFRILPPAINEAQTIRSINTLCFFLFDACSVHMDLGALINRCRRNFPGSKSLALLPPAVSNTAERVRLFHWGVDGYVDFDEGWHRELPRAVDSILRGQLWASRDVLDTFVRHERTLLETQLLPDRSLTARERQILQLLMRGLGNKEISNSLQISERTVKFHVSNILCKLHLEDRRRMLPERLATTSSG